MPPWWRAAARPADRVSASVPPPAADKINFPLMLDVSRTDLTAGVAGAGTMGRGIAQVLAHCGARTLLFDAQPGAAQKGKAAIADALGQLAEKGRVKPAEADATLGRLEVVDKLE